MIGTSLPEYVFIRACILFLHHVAPACALYCMILIILYPAGYRIPLLLELWAIVESLFLLLVYYPRNLSLQHAASHPQIASKVERGKLFQQCSDTIDDPEHYLSLWHRGAPAAEIKRENVKGKKLLATIRGQVKLLM